MPGVEPSVSTEEGLRTKTLLRVTGFTLSEIGIVATVDTPSGTAATANLIEWVIDVLS
jgi:hypothetical protein